jgi:hypothetical protein
LLPPATAARPSVPKGRVNSAAVTNSNREANYIVPAKAVGCLPPPAPARTSLPKGHGTCAGAKNSNAARAAGETIARMPAKARQPVSPRQSPEAAE